MGEAQGQGASVETRATLVPLLVRGCAGGALMGLANLVPGISGGTMLLATGVYTLFIAAIAEVTTLRFRRRSLLLLGSVVATAALAILLLAGSVKELVQNHRWVMYSLFIGLTLGGVPLVWRMARPASRSLCLGALAAFALMVLMATGGPVGGGGGKRNTALVFSAGVAASSAMILPGVSGGYLLLLLGQYEAILGTVDQLKLGVLGPTAPDLPLVVDSLAVVIPLGLGIALGVAGVSNLLRWLLQRYEKPTLGVLLGLLLGAVVGLWPFQQARPPTAGDTVHGRVLSTEEVAGVATDDWPLATFRPSAAQLAGSLALIGVGVVGTSLIGRLGREGDT